MSVVRLSDKTDDAKFIDAVSALRDTANEIESGKLVADMCLVLLLDTRNDAFGLSFRNAKMKCSQMLAACEVMKGRCLAMMGIVHGPDSD